MSFTINYFEDIQIYAAHYPDCICGFFIENIEGAPSGDAGTGKSAKTCSQ